jgi:hypothetical protein
VPSNVSRPFFSIGVTTYDSLELLRQCLQSILEQEFPDFEVLIGNDCVSKPITEEMLGFHDPRLRIVNHALNLGETGNLNSLLGLAQGRYFTWQADDDYYHPRFLADVHAAIIANHGVQAVFTSYRVNRNVSGRPRLGFKPSVKVDSPIIRGADLLRGYWRGSVKIMGMTGVYETGQLRDFGGAARLADAPIAIMSEWLLLIQSGLLERVVFIDRPLIYYRAHAGSWSATSADAANYKIAGGNLLRAALPVLQDARLSGDFTVNLAGLIKLIILAVAKFGARRRGGVKMSEMLAYINSLRADSLGLVADRHREDSEMCLAAARKYWLRIYPAIFGLAIIPPALWAMGQRLRGVFSDELVN